MGAWLGLGALSALALLALWVLPYRLGTEGGASYYTFNLICDETSYAGKIQPRLAGATAQNPVNGIADPGVIPQFYLESACHAFVTLTGMHVITFFWIWRVLFPIAAGATLLLLARECLPRRRPWNAALAAAAGICLLPALYCLYALLLPPPADHWLNRIPTNIEFPLSILALVFLARLVKSGAPRKALPLAATLLVLGYFRPYAAAPLGALIVPALLLMAWRGRMRWAVPLALICVLAAGGLPWLLASFANSAHSVYQEWFVRYFKPGQPYAVFVRWPWHAGIAAGFGALAFFLKPPWRLFAILSALLMLFIPFGSGLFSIKAELLHYLDRFGCFYLPLLFMFGLLLLAQRMESLRGRARLHAARRWTVVFSAAALAGSLAIAAVNLRYSFEQDYLSNHTMLIADQRYLPAYDWIRQHTPQDALFVVDDGADWGQLTGTAWDGVTEKIWDRIEYFTVIARRRAVFEPRLFGFFISKRDLDALKLVQFGTLGLDVDREQYVAALKEVLPTHIFWRKSNHYPRGYGVVLQRMAKTVYEDAVCEVWEMSYAGANEAVRAAKRP